MKKTRRDIATEAGSSNVGQIRGRKKPLIVGRARSFPMPQQEFIKRLGISNSYILSIRKAGYLDGSWQQRGGRYFYNWPTAVRLLRENLSDQSKLGGSGLPPEGADEPAALDETPGELPTAATGYAAARARSEQARAGLRALELHERAGSLVPADEVRAGLVSIARALRDQMLSIPDRVSAVLSVERREETIHKILSEEIDTACREFDISKVIKGLENGKRK